VLFTLVFGAIAVVNVYWQLRAPTSTSDVWGWLGMAVVTFSCIALLLYVTTMTYRLKFYEAGLIILGLRGRHFVAWSAVRQARLARFRGSIELALRTDARKIPYSIPLNSYKKQLTLLAEIRRRLPVPVHDPANITATLTDD
jgi:hypothetical protein